MCFPAAAWAAFQDAKPPFYFLMIILLASMQVLDKNYFFRQRIACQNRFAIHAIQQ
jgi:hypothetical protein